MKYTGITYRPPFEAASLLLQVTEGCSHNRCAFCTMYRDTPFRAESMDQIEKDLDEARVWRPRARRVFLENGDPFALSADRLKEIATLIHEKLPEVQTIAMYASINNIRGKTDEELKELCELGINDLNIGLESGMDSALELMCKGYDSAEAIEQLLRLKKAGIRFGVNIIFGMAGPALRREHAVATAELLNKVQPNLVFTGTIHAEPGCPLYEWATTGTFIENTLGEYFDEIETFVSHLELEDCRYYGLHPSNIFCLDGRLGRDKDRLLAEIEIEKLEWGPEQMNRRLHHYAEGAVSY